MSCVPGLYMNECMRRSMWVESEQGKGVGLCVGLGGLKRTGIKGARGARNAAVA